MEANFIYISRINVIELSTVDFKNQSEVISELHVILVELISIFFHGICKIKVGKLKKKVGMMKDNTEQV
jgi:hypothetical protein